MSKRTYTITLTAAELNGLAALAGEGAEGLFSDPAAARAYIGTGAQIAAAKRAQGKLDSANARANHPLAKAQHVTTQPKGEA